MRDRSTGAGVMGGGDRAGVRAIAGYDVVVLRHRARRVDAAHEHVTTGRFGLDERGRRAAS